MKERPILFSGPMVRAILECRKTQTRRVVKPQNEHWPSSISGKPYPSTKGLWRECPYGVPGDRLWVRETWSLTGAVLIDPCLNYKADNAQRPINHHKTHADMWYLAGSNQWIDGDALMKVPDREGWHPSIHMPRWASRITLEITNLRVQRLQEISEEDAKAEGVDVLSDSADPARWKFIGLWESINEKRGFGWDANPWVWAITFRRL